MGAFLCVAMQVAGLVFEGWVLWSLLLLTQEAWWWEDPGRERFFADQWVAKGSENGLGGKTEKAFKKELGGLGFTLKASPQNGGGVEEEVPAGRLQQDRELVWRDGIEGQEE